MVVVPLVLEVVAAYKLSVTPEMTSEMVLLLRVTDRPSTVNVASLAVCPETTLKLRPSELVTPELVRVKALSTPVAPVVSIW